MYEAKPKISGNVKHMKYLSKRHQWLEKALAEA